MVKELNDLVSGFYVEASPEAMLTNSPQFFQQFTIVIATQVCAGLPKGLDRLLNMQTSPFSFSVLCPISAIFVFCPLSQCQRKVPSAPCMMWPRCQAMLGAQEMPQAAYTCDTQGGRCGACALAVKGA